LSVGATSILANKVHKTPNKEDKKKTAIKNTIILGVTALSAISAPYIASKLTGRLNYQQLRNKIKKSLIVLLKPIQILT